MGQDLGPGFWGTVHDETNARPLNEKKEHYYSIVKNDEDDYFKIDGTRVKSYEAFLKEPQQ